MPWDTLPKARSNPLRKREKTGIKYFCLALDNALMGDPFPARPPEAGRIKAKASCAKNPGLRAPRFPIPIPGNPPRNGTNVVKEVGIRTGVHAFLDGVITRVDIEEFGFPLPLANTVEVKFNSPVLNEQLAAAYAQIAQARYYHHRTAPCPELLKPAGGQPKAIPQSSAPEPAKGNQPGTRKSWIELSQAETGFKS